MFFNETISAIYRVPYNFFWSFYEVQVNRVFQEKSIKKVYKRLYMLILNISTGGNLHLDGIIHQPNPRNEEAT